MLKWQAVQQPKQKSPHDWNWLTPKHWMLQACQSEINLFFYLLCVATWKREIIQLQTMVLISCVYSYLLIHRCNFGPCCVPTEVVSQYWAWAFFRFFIGNLLNVACTWNTQRHNNAWLSPMPVEVPSPEQFFLWCLIDIRGLYACRRRMRVIIKVCLGRERKTERNRERKTRREREDRSRDIN